MVVLEDDQTPTDPQPSLARLDALMDRLRQSGLRVELSITGPGAAVPPGVDLSAYRIIQEALTNVIKHAGPHASARVDVVRGAEAVSVRVRDEGGAPSEVAADAARNGGRGQGLLGIRERVAVVGGRVDAGPDDRGGFVVTAELPYAVEG